MFCAGNHFLIERIQSRLARALEVQGSAKAIRTHSGTALGSSVGMVRKRNEDCCLVARASYATGGPANFTMAVVCDGLGGMSHGREAAVIAASAFTAYLFCGPTIDLSDRLLRAAAFANTQIYERLRGDGGTTLSAVVYFNHHGAMLCHIGDSRIYGVSPDRALHQLSRDDTMNALLHRRESEADVPKDSRLLQFVGMGDEMDAQIAPVPPNCRSVLVTSDGAHDVPLSVLQRVVSAAAGGSDLIRKLLTLSDMLGGRDNASAILLPIGGEADFFNEIGENELLAILPTDTIHFVGSEVSEWSGRTRNQSSDNPREEQFKRSEDVRSKEEGPRPESGGAKSSVQKVKGRPAKQRKTRRRSARPNVETPDRLPLDEPGNEVDIQFSSPSAKSRENKK